VTPALQLSARRLRYLRQFPPMGRFPGENDRQASSFAYEHALRVVLDEHGILPGSDLWASLFYGPQAESFEAQAPL
jgi:hypothetical protein